MSANIDPAQSAIAAFVDLGKRVGTFAACAGVGVLVGLFSAWLNHQILGGEVVESSALDEILDDPLAFRTESKFAKLPQFFMSILGIVPLFYGLVKIVKGSSSKVVLTLAMIGAAILAAVSTAKSGWTLGGVFWVTFIILTVGCYWAALKWEARQERLWEEGLSEIYAENEQRREQIAQEEADAESQVAMNNQVYTAPVEQPAKPTNLISIPKKPEEQG